MIGAQTVVAKDGINLQRTITMGKPLISGSVTRPFYKFGGTKLVQNFQTICKLLIYMLKNGGQGGIELQGGSDNTQVVDFGFGQKG